MALNDNSVKTTDELVEFITGDVSPEGGDDNDEEIAESLIDTDEVDEDDSEEDLSDDTDEEEDVLEGDDDAEESDEDEDSSDTADNDEDDIPYLDITDEDLIEVKIDDEVVYKSVADAKKALSGEGAIEKRLKEATQARNAAQTAYEQGVQSLEEKRLQLVKTVQQLEGYIFQSTVPKPDETLRQQSPEKYLAAMDAFNADQARIAQGKQQLAQNLAQQNQEREQNLAQLRQSHDTKLRELIPSLNDDKLAPEIYKSIVEVGNEYGYSNEEMATFFDSRAFFMAYELAQLKKLRGKAKLSDKDKESRKTTKRGARRLRSGVAAKQLKAKQSAKQRKAVRDKAATTGKVDDVTAFILNPARSRRK